MQVLYDCIQERASHLLDTLNPNAPEISDQQSIEGPSTNQMYLTSDTEHQKSLDDANENIVEVAQATSTNTEYSPGEVKVLEYVNQRMGARTQNELILLATNLYRIMKFSQPFLNMHNF